MIVVVSVIRGRVLVRVTPTTEVPLETNVSVQVEVDEIVALD